MKSDSSVGGCHGGSRGTEPSNGRKGGMGSEEDSFDELLRLALALGVCRARRGDLEKVRGKGKVVCMKEETKAMIIVRFGRSHGRGGGMGIWSE